MRQPTKFGKYLLLERIAVGGMAEVFVAKAFGVEGFERLLAIKKILPTMGEDAEFISMFIDEARIAVQLSHANIVQVLELGKHDENLYIAMEYISGRDVRQLLEWHRRRKQPMPIPQACLIVAEVCEALDYAHRKRDASGRPLGIVHRDVSPQNVLVSFEGEVKLIDFGIAKAESRLQKTQAGILKGKFSYMSPEQVKGQPIDGRSDIFAAGILLWELVCGEKLFTGDSDFAILEKVRSGLVTPPRTVARACSEELEKVILKALATDPAQRYQTASELHDDLVRFTTAGDTVFGSRQLAGWLREEFAQDWQKEQNRLRGWLGITDETSEVTPSGPRKRKEVPRVVPADLGITPVDAFPGPALQNAMEAASSEPTELFRVAPDHDTLALPPPKGTPSSKRPSPAHSSELPTMEMNDAALVEAEKKIARQAQGGIPTVSVAFGDEDEPTEIDVSKTSTKIAAWRKPPEIDAPKKSAEVVVAKPAAAAARSSPADSPSKSPGAPPAKTPRRWPLYVGGPLLLAVAATLFFLQPEEEARPGRIVVALSPSVPADLLIDGKAAGKLPPFVHVVAAGTHRIEVRAEGYKPFSTQVQVPSGGRPLEIEAQLASDGPMQVEGVVLTQPRPEPPAAPPQRPRKKHGWQKKTAAASRRPEPVLAPAAPVEEPAPAEPVETPAAPKEIEKPAPVRVVAEMEVPNVIEAAPVPAASVGYLTAATKPAARLTIDGRDTGRWTPVPAANPIALPPGAHTLVFETADGRRLEEQLQIEAGKTSRVVRALP